MMRQRQTFSVSIEEPAKNIDEVIRQTGSWPS